MSNMANEDVKTREDLAAEAFGTTLEDIRKVRDRAINCRRGCRAGGCRCHPRARQIMIRHLRRRWCLFWHSDRAMIRDGNGAYLCTRCLMSWPTPWHNG